MSIIQDIKNAACGENENGKAKCVVSVGAHIYNTENSSEKPKTIAEVNSLDPIVEIRSHGEFAWVDLKFSNENSLHLSQIFSCLERYLAETGNDVEGRETAAFISLIPVSMGGRYYINCLNPIFWALLPDTIGGSLRNLRITFYADDVLFNESDVDDNFAQEIIKSAESASRINDEDNLYDYDDDDNLDYLNDEDDDEVYDEDDDDSAEYDYISEGDMRDAEFDNEDEYLTEYDEDNEA